MIHQSQIVDVAEHFETDIKSSYSPLSIFEFAPNSYGKVTIHRNLLDDTFDIEIPNELIKRNIPADSTPYISINNEIILEGKDVAARATNYENRKIFKIHHSMMRNFKFRNLKELIVGTMIGRFVGVMFSIKFDFHDIADHVELKEGQVARITAYKTINVQLTRSMSDASRLDPENKCDQVISGVKESIVYAPVKRDRTDAVTEIAKIYTHAEDNPISTSGIIPDVKSSLETTGTSKNISAILDKRENGSTLDLESSIGSTRYKYLYTSLIDTSTYYNYEKARTEVGFLEGAKVGEFIPYNYRGVYVWIHKLKLWEFIKNFEFRYQEEYDTPLLDPYDGDIVLEASNSYDSPVTTNMSLTLDDLELIRQNELISLKGLERISSEEAS